MKLKRVGIVVGLSLLVVTSALLVTRPGASQPASTKRTIHMAAIEPRGGTSVTSEPFPSVPLSAGPGYVLRQPDGTGRWEVSAYYWQPGFIVVSEGEDVTLEILGINGAEHPTFIDGIPVPSFNVKRGQITTVDFNARRAGTYRIVCTAHQPTMVAHLIVLPRR